MSVVKQVQVQPETKVLSRSCQVVDVEDEQVQLAVDAQKHLLRLHIKDLCMYKPLLLRCLVALRAFTFDLLDLGVLLSPRQVLIYIIIHISIGVSLILDENLRLLVLIGL